MKMKKFSTAFATLLLLLLLPITAADARTQTDTFIDKEFDFSRIKRLYVWPPQFENLPASLELSLPGLVDEWIATALSNKRMKGDIFVKPTDRMWQDTLLMAGAGTTSYTRPFESDESTAFFRSHLGDVCDGVLFLTVSLEQKRQWQEPRTETYTTTERVRSVERRRRTDGKYEEVEVYVDVPVTKVRQIPGRWFVSTGAWCKAELFDAKNLEGKFVEAARSESTDSCYESEDVAQMSKNVLKGAVNASLAAIFYTPKK